MAKEVGVMNYVARRIAWKLRTRKAMDRIPYRLPGGQSIQLPAGSPFASDIYCTGGYVDWGSEQLLLEYLAQFRSPAACYDVGANMGFYSVLLASAAGPVFAFEPDPRNHADLLAQGIENLTLVPKAVSETRGLARFDVSSGSTVGHLSSKVSAAGQIEVECITLDEFRNTRPANEKVVAVKMDVEGYELSCLRGASRIASEERPVFLIEFGIEEGRPNSFSGLGAFVEINDYDIIAMIRKPHGFLGFRTVLEQTRAETLASQDHKMLFLAPREETFFKDKVRAAFCFEDMRRSA